MHLHRNGWIAIIIILIGIVIPSTWCATLEDLYGDGQSSSCTANATPIEEKILDRESGLYVYPTSLESDAILAAIDALLERDPERADAEAAAAGYGVNSFFDSERGRLHNMLEPDGFLIPGHA